MSKNKKKKSNLVKVKLEFDQTKITKERFADIVFHSLNLYDDMISEKEPVYRQNEYTQVWNAFFQTFGSLEFMNVDKIVLDEIYSQEFES